MRDSQRSKVYRAEKIELPNNCRIESIEEIQQFVNKIINSTWTAKRYNQATHSVVNVKDGRGRRRACSWRNAISLPVWARTKLFILHEIAHTVNVRMLTPPIGFTADHAAHGWEFAGIYLDLVKHFMGHEDFNLLKDSFRKNHVRFRPKRTRKIAMNSKTIEALAKYREQKKKEILAAKEQDISWNTEE